MQLVQHRVILYLYISYLFVYIVGAQNLEITRVVQQPYFIILGDTTYKNCFSMASGNKQQLNAHDNLVLESIFNPNLPFDVCAYHTPTDASIGAVKTTDHGNAGSK